MKFILTIELGNDAMQTPLDTAWALRELINGNTFESSNPWSEDRGKIRDVNGNTVGKWEVIA